MASACSVALVEALGDDLPPDSPLRALSAAPAPLSDTTLESAALSEAAVVLVDARWTLVVARCFRPMLHRVLEALHGAKRDAAFGARVADVLVALGRVVDAHPEQSAPAVLQLLRTLPTPLELAVTASDPGMQVSMLRSAEAFVTHCPTLRTQWNWSALFPMLRAPSAPLRALASTLVATVLGMSDAQRSQLAASTQAAPAEPVGSPPPTPPRKRTRKGDAVPPGAPSPKPALDSGGSGMDESTRVTEAWQRDTAAASVALEAFQPLHVAPEAAPPPVDALAQLTSFIAHRGRASDETPPPAPPAGARRLTPTPTTCTNLRQLAMAVMRGAPVLVEGPPGAGKSASIWELAHRSNNAHGLIELHLDDSIDSKSLLGTYVCTDVPGEFRWSPGPLTQAVQAGRWVIIEDVDGVPFELLSSIIPLLETNTLVLPGRGDPIPAAPGFQLFGTRSVPARACVSPGGGGVRLAPLTPPLSHFGGLWTRVPVAPLSPGELATVLESRFPVPASVREWMMAVYCMLGGGVMPTSDAAGDAPVAAVAQLLARAGRTLSPRTLLTWAARVQALTLAPTAGDSDFLTEDVKRQVILEAFDVMVAFLPSPDARREALAAMAQSWGLDVDETLHHHLVARKPGVEAAAAGLRVGRATLPLAGLRAGAAVSPSPLPAGFMPTRHALQLMERLACGVQMAEPMLLVGETGNGKTSVIQALASACGQTLRVQNLNVQSDSGDLFGGFRPVQLRQIAYGLLTSLLELWPKVLSATQNQAFLGKLHTVYKKENWKAFSRGVGAAVEKLRPHVVGAAEDKEGGASRGAPRPRGADGVAEHFGRVEADLAQFKKQAGDTSHPFAFAFVEGLLVKAARDGEWILLDELNLAPPDTLQRLAGLLDTLSAGDGGLSLTERGDVEALTIHPGFRVFAAMNPPTDYGKRDLPPALRNRFTEVFVDEVVDADDLRTIVHGYLQHIPGDLPVDALVSFFLAARDLSQTTLMDGGHQRPRYSLRTLCRALRCGRELYELKYPLGVGLYEGLCMSFLTQLEAPSAAILGAELAKRREFRDAAVAAGKRKGRRPGGKATTGDYLPVDNFWLKAGPLPPQDMTAPDGAGRVRFVVVPSVRRHIRNLSRTVLSRRYPVLLQGPTSSGKTTMVEYLAALTGHRCVRINNHEHTDLQEYIGTYVSAPSGKLVFQEGALVEAVRNGYWIILDELNLAPSEVLEALNRLLDDNRELFISETQEVVTPHPNFMLFATQNPAGIYGGRKPLSQAFRNRFLELHVDDIPAPEMVAILQQRCRLPPKFCQRMVDTMVALQQERQQSQVFAGKHGFITPRDLLRWGSRAPESEQELAAHGYMLLAERLRNDAEKAMVKRVLEEKCLKITRKAGLDVEALYYGGPPPPELPATGPAGTEGVSDITWTRSMRRLFKLVGECFAKAEPVLLVGDTGCGKTTVCQVYALLMQRQLHIVNCHQHTETSDFLGGLRPARGADAGGALFEWQDGPLVTAMRAGHLFLLDELSLADDAVLERLNSVLEPSRTLTLAERGGATVDVVRAAPAFLFMATMNPGGDFGKRELSPALRNRFTEIWVPPIVDARDLELLIHDKLARAAAVGALATPAPAVDLPAVLPAFTAPMLEFVMWFHATAAAGTLRKPGSAAPGASTPKVLPLTLRDVQSWARFMASAVGHSGVQPWLAYVHGAAMVLLDGLALGTGLAQRDIDAIRAAAYGVILGQVPDGDRPAATSQVVATHGSTPPPAVSTPDTFGVAPFFVPAGRLPVPPSVAYAMGAPTTARNLVRVLRALQLPHPILLEGSPGVGKTSLISALAKASGHRLVRINLSEQTDVADLLGSDLPVEGAEGDTGPRFRWCDGVFLEALRAGDWVLLDELNLASQSVLEGLNACLDHRGVVYIPEIDQSFECPPTFRVFAAQNPFNQGGGRKGLPKSFLNRFTKVFVDPLSDADLLFICEAMHPGLASVRWPHAPGGEASLLQLMIAFNQGVQTDTEVGAYGRRGAPWEFNLRDVFRWCEVTEHLQATAAPGGGLPPVCDTVHTLYTQRLRTPGDRRLLAARFEEVFGCPPAAAQPPALVASPTLVTLGAGALGRATDVPLAPPHAAAAARRMPLLDGLLPPLQHVGLCVELGWPALLVGPPASGKTASLRLLASLCNRSLREITLSSSADSTDLLGCFEQVDPRRWVETATAATSAGATAALRALLLAPGDQACLHSRAAALCDAWWAVQAAGLEGAQLGGLHAAFGDALAAGLPDVAARRVQAAMAALAEAPARAAAVSARGRFEWVDGALLTAVERGEWVVLDNANFCNPTVLDRLNPLLEPGGVLMVNECGLVDGKPRVVTPHPDFRLFLVMDPTHGEVSRAMRNRCVEVSFLAPGPPARSLVDVAPATPDATPPASLSSALAVVAAAGVPGHFLGAAFVAAHRAVAEAWPSRTQADAPTFRTLHQWSRMAACLCQWGYHTAVRTGAASVIEDTFLAAYGPFGGSVDTVRAALLAAPHMQPYPSQWPAQATAAAFSEDATRAVVRRRSSLPVFLSLARAEESGGVATGVDAVAGGGGLLHLTAGAGWGDAEPAPGSGRAWATACLDVAWRVFVEGTSRLEEPLAVGFASGLAAGMGLGEGGSATAGTLLHEALHSAPGSRLTGVLVAVRSALGESVLATTVGMLPMDPRHSPAVYARVLDALGRCLPPVAAPAVAARVGLLSDLLAARNRLVLFEVAAAHNAAGVTPAHVLEGGEGVAAVNAAAVAHLLAAGSTSRAHADAIRKVCHPAVTHLNVLFGAVDGLVSAWVDAVCGAVPATTAAADGAESALHAAVGGALPLLRRVLDARAALWCVFAGVTFAPGGGAAALSEAAFPADGVAVAWRWLLKPLAAWVSAVKQWWAAPGLPERFAMVARAAPAFAATVGVAPGVAQATNDLGWLLAHTRATLWKYGGHPALPPSPDAQAAAVGLRAQSFGVGLDFAGPAPGSEVTTGHTVALDALLRGCHPAAFLTGADKAALVEAVCMLAWAAAESGGNEDALEAASTAEAAIAAAVASACQRRLVDVVVAAGGATAVTPPEAAGRLPTLDLVFTTGDMGAVGAVLLMTSASLHLRRQWARHTLWPMTEAWSVAQERVLLAAGLHLAWQVAVACPAAAPPHWQIVGDGEGQQWGALWGSVTKHLQAVQEWVEFVLSGTPRPPADVAPHQQLVWACHMFTAPTPPADQDAVTGGLQAFVARMHALAVDVQYAWHARVWNAAFRSPFAVSPSLSPRPPTHRALAALFGEGDEAGAGLDANADDGLVGAPRVLLPGLALRTLGMQGDVPTLLDADAHFHRAAVLARFAGGKRGVPPAVLDAEADLPMAVFADTALAFQPTVAGGSLAAVLLPLRDGSNPGAGDALLQLLATSTDGRLATAVDAHARPALEAALAALGGDVAAIGRAWVEVGLLRAVCGVPVSAVDPAEKPAVKLAVVQHAKAELEQEQTVRAVAHALDVGAGATPTPPLAAVQERLRGVEEAAAGWASRVVRRCPPRRGGGPPATYRGLASDCRSLLSTLLAVDRVRTLAADLTAGAGAARAQEGSWQAAVGSFLADVATRYAGFEDVWKPFGLAVAQVRHGMRLLAASPALGAKPATGLVPPSALLQFPTVSGGFPAVVGSLLDTLGSLVGSTASGAPLLRRRLFRTALCHVRLWLAASDGVHGDAVAAACRMFHLLSASWEAGNGDAAMLAARVATPEAPEELFGRHGEAFQDILDAAERFHDGDDEDPDADDGEGGEEGDGEEAEGTVGSWSTPLDLAPEDMDALSACHVATFSGLVGVDEDAIPGSGFPKCVGAVVEDVLPDDDVKGGVSVASAVDDGDCLRLATLRHAASAATAAIRMGGADGVGDATWAAAGGVTLSVATVVAAGVHAAPAAVVKWDAVQSAVNVAEVRRVAPPVSSLLHRVQELLHTWPENGVLMLIMRVGQRVLALGLHSPVAKVLTGVELLLAKCQDWETTASTAVSLAEHLAPLSALITRWRKLELKSWEELLGVREEAYRRQAQAWWPRLFAALVAPAALGEDTTEDSHVAAVADLMHEFVCRSSVGEFRWRLGLLAAFGRHLIALSRTAHPLAAVHARLAAFLLNANRYYSVFAPAVEGWVAARRAPIEKALKDQVKIHKWDEQTYYALQESASKSHRALHRLVCKYDEVLGSPASAVLDAEFAVTPSSALDTGAALPRSAPAVYAPTSPGFASKAVPLEALRRGALPPQGLDLLDIPRLHRRLHKVMRGGVLGGAAGGRRAAAAAGTDALAGSVVSRVNHLRDSVAHMQVKRRALVQLFHRLAAMGLKPLHESAVPATQANSAALFQAAPSLASAPGVLQAVLPSWGAPAAVAGANGYFFKAVAGVDHVRSAAGRQWHTDLSGAEVTKAVGITQHLLHVSLQQRHAVDATRQFLARVDAVGQALGELPSALAAATLAAPATVAEGAIPDLHARLTLAVEHLAQCQLVCRSLQLCALPDDSCWTAVDDRRVGDATLPEGVVDAVEGALSELRVALAAAGARMEAQAARAALGAGFEVPHVGALDAAAFESAKDSAAAASGAISGVLASFAGGDGVVVRAFADVAGVLDGLNACIAEHLGGGQAAGAGGAGSGGDEAFAAEFRGLVQDAVSAVLVTLQPLGGEGAWWGAAVRGEDKGKEDEAAAGAGGVEGEEGEEEDPSGDVVVVVDETSAAVATLQALRRVDVVAKARAVVECLLPALSPSSGISVACLAGATAVAADLRPLLDACGQVVGMLTADVLCLHRATCKLLHVLCRVVGRLMVDGFCAPGEDDGGDAQAGKFEDDVEGTGMGEGEGKKDVSDQIEDEEQILGLKGEEQEAKDDMADMPEEDNGIEMQNDFEGALHDVPPDAGDDGPEGEEEEEEEDLDREMGDVEDSGEQIVDEKMWGNDSDDDEAEEQEDEKFEKDAPLAGPQDEEIRAKEGDGDDDKDGEGKKEDGQQKQEGGEEEEEDGGEEEGEDGVNREDEDMVEDTPGIEVKPEALPGEDDALQLDDDLNIGEDGEEEEKAGEEDGGPEDGEDIVDPLDEPEEGGGEEEPRPEGDDGEEGEEEEEATGAGHAPEAVPDDDDMGEDPEAPPPSAEVKEEEDTAARADERGTAGGAGGGIDAVDDEEKEEDVKEKDGEEDKGDENADDDDGGGVERQEDDADAPEAQPGDDSGRQGQTAGADDGEWQRADEPQEGGGEDARHRPPPATPRDSQAMNPYADPDKALRQWEAHLREMQGLPAEDGDGEDDDGGMDDDEEQGATGGDVGATDAGGVFMLAPVEETEEPPAPEVEGGEEEGGDDDLDLDGGEEDVAGGEEDDDYAGKVEEGEEGEGEEGEEEDGDVEPRGGASKVASRKLRGEVGEGEEEEEDGGSGADGGSGDDDDDDMLGLEADRPTAVLDAPEYAIHTGRRGAGAGAEIALEDVDVEAMRERFETNVSQWDALGEGRAGRAAAAWGSLSTLAEEQAGQLCESLRLLLDPTLATRLQGDYKTGKRINIRKIIPYIASQFRKDKIWLRRTKPSKRQYHVMVAIDNSRSMADTSARAMACEAMATICTAMAKLEVGDIGVCSFGSSVELLHPFGQPFTADAGARVLSQFSFDQESTRLVETLHQLIGVLDDAKQHVRETSLSRGKCMQIVFMISDGILGGSDRERIRQAVLTAASRNQLLALLIIGNPESSNSILATKQLVYDSKGNMAGFKSYMEDYPFPWFVLVRDVRSLPQALSDCLRQWFEAINTK